MSYDLWIEPAGLCEDEDNPLAGCLYWNYTSNCSPMWRAAGADLAEFHGKTTDECVPILRSGIAELANNPEKYQAMNPENGWGSWESLVPRLAELLIALENHPGAVVKVCR